MKRIYASAIGIAALLGGAPLFAQGASGGSHGGGASATAGLRAGGMGVGASMGAGMAAGPASPNAVGAGSLLTGMDRAADATSGNANASAGFTSAMELRAAAQNRRTTARANSQASAHASDTAKAHANTNSVLNDETTTTAAPPRR